MDNGGGDDGGGGSGSRGWSRSGGSGSGFGDLEVARRRRGGEYDDRGAAAAAAGAVTLRGWRLVVRLSRGGVGERYRFALVSKMLLWEW